MILSARTARTSRTPVFVLRRATTRTGVRLGLITATPERVAVPSRSPSPTHPHSQTPTPTPTANAPFLLVKAGRHSVLRARAREAWRLVTSPGPLYFAGTMLAGMGAAFLVGLWLL